jgi:lysine/ornithine N-monooxygenase
MRKMETTYLKQIVEMAKESKENLNIRKEIIIDKDVTNEQLGQIIRQMYNAKVDEANETIKRVTQTIKEYEK